MKSDLSFASRSGAMDAMTSFDGLSIEARSRSNAASVIERPTKLIVVSHSSKLREPFPSPRLSMSWYSLSMVLLSVLVRYSATSTLPSPSTSMDSKMSFSIWRRPGGKAGSALDARGSAFDARGSAFDAREAREVAGGVAVLAPHPIQVIDI
jgi:hypothetical protein